ncbi:aldose 1-epimerase [Nitzschia inconspicua]|uniref:glucose-6-phosphate 1-epimerase n=1 Tax=Nitzschia inconspicua TaxID=303405 RepID=A0A9K3P7M4_9STRA|nr:aldose 1-epimerase [Nitzschia inconspicua]
MSNIRIVTHSASGASCKIHDFGACLISYQTGAGRECLFVSRDAKMDGSKAIRGGVPLVFPQFGQPDKSMPQHGFLRTNYWTVDESSAFDTKESAGITYTLQLKDAKAARGGIWDEQTMFDCTCLYHVMIDGTKLTTTLEIQNTSTKRFSFKHCCIPTILWMGNKLWMDQNATSKVWKGETDRVYNPPVGKDMVEVTIGVGKGKELKLTAVGTVDGKKKPVSCVVWNPYIEKARGLSDFGDDQYQEMIVLSLVYWEKRNLKGEAFPS